MSPRPFPRSALLICAALASPLAACDLLESAQATTVVGGLIVESPQVSVADRLDWPGEIAATAWVGERASPTSTEPPMPIGDATVTVAFRGVSVSLPVQSTSAGLYAQDSAGDPNLEVVPGAQYVLEARINDSPFGGRVGAPARLTPAALTLSPSPTMFVDGLPNVGVHPASTALTLTWGEQFGRYSYVTVLRADPNDPSNPEQVYDNAPGTAGEILNFVLGSPSRREVIPAESFARDGLYAVILVAMNNTDDLLTDTFLGSPILVGTGTAVFVAVGQLP